MASLLVIEDGTGLADANSYVSADEARTYATLRGVTLPAAPESGTDPVEIFLVKACDYLNSKSYVGTRATGAQALEWPRVLSYPIRNYPYINLGIFGWWDDELQAVNVDSSYYVVANEVKNAQMQLCIEQQNGIVLMPSTPGGKDGQYIIREKVDVIETAYSERVVGSTQPSMPAVDAILRLITVPAGLRTVRV